MRAFACFFLLYLGRWIKEMMREMNALGNAVEREKVQCIVGSTV